MNYYIIPDANGLIGQTYTGFLEELGELASSAIEVDQLPDQYAEYWDGAGFQPLPPRPNAFAVFDGTAWVDPDDVATAIADAMLNVNVAAGRVRSTFATNIPFQDALYLEKRVEALAYQALATPPADLSDFPLIAMEVGVTADTASQVAATVIAKDAAWKAKLAEIEGVRLRAIAEINTETSASAIAAMQEAAVAALDALASD